jgi:hypothetical protein
MRRLIPLAIIACTERPGSHSLSIVPDKRMIDKEERVSFDASKRRLRRLPWKASSRNTLRKRQASVAGGRASPGTAFG